MPFNTPFVSAVTQVDSQCSMVPPHSAVAWSPDGTLLTVSDDKTVCRWSADGDMQGSFPINVFGTNVSWFPKSGKQV